ncbi:hypothetical protein Rhopal_005301-T1 [Rhodotorula paludigena]|uniref:FHA domain-containing protein n=1 Tax=Rhodotorula paludigena TaxID=86838 RepID=A0AAV5GI21_9BASI|nr:hypothetical protein Rhopal_005301-T1 [Rhodotorula paludigena]
MAEFYLTLAPPSDPGNVLKQFARSQGNLDLGRASKTDPASRDPSSPKFRSPETKVMSNRHASIHWEGDHAFITDLGSTNGTSIDRPSRGEHHKLTPDVSYRLFPGDVLIFGRPISTRGQAAGEIATFPLIQNVCAPLRLAVDVKLTPSIYHAHAQRGLETQEPGSIALERSRTLTEGSKRSSSAESMLTDDEDDMPQTLETEGYDIMSLRSNRNPASRPFSLEGIVASREASILRSVGVDDDAGKGVAIRKRGFGLTDEDLLDSNHTSPAPQHEGVQTNAPPSVAVSSVVDARAISNASMRGSPVPTVSPNVADDSSGPLERTASVVTSATGVTSASYRAVAGSPAPQMPGDGPSRDARSSKELSPESISLEDFLAQSADVGLASPISPEFGSTTLATDAEQDVYDEAKMPRSTNPSQVKVGRTLLDMWGHHTTAERNSPLSKSLRSSIEPDRDSDQVVAAASLEAPFRIMPGALHKFGFHPVTDDGEQDDVASQASHLPSPDLSGGAASDKASDDGVDSDVENASKEDAPTTEDDSHQHEDVRVDSFEQELLDLARSKGKYTFARSNSSGARDSPRRSPINFNVEPDLAARRAASHELFDSLAPTLPNMVNKKLMHELIDEGYDLARRIKVEDAPDVTLAEYEDEQDEKGERAESEQPPPTSPQFAADIEAFTRDREDVQALMREAEHVFDDFIAEVISEASLSPALVEDEEDEDEIEDADSVASLPLADEEHETVELDVGSESRDIAADDDYSASYRFSTASPLSLEPNAQDDLEHEDDVAAFVEFQNARWDDYCARYDALADNEIAEMLDQVWQDMSREEKQPWLDRVAEQPQISSVISTPRDVDEEERPASPMPVPLEALVTDDDMSVDDDDERVSGRAGSGPAYDESEEDEEDDGDEAEEIDYDEEEDDEEEEEDEDDEDDEEEEDEDEDEVVEEVEEAEEAEESLFDLEAEEGEGGDDEVESVVESVVLENEVEPDVDAVDLDFDAHETDLDVQDHFIDGASADFDDNVAEVDAVDGMEHDGAEWEDGVFEKLATPGFDQVEKADTTSDDDKDVVVDGSHGTTPTGPASPNRKRLFSDTDLEETVEGSQGSHTVITTVVTATSVSTAAQTDAPVVNETPTTAEGPAPKRRRLNFAIGSYALGVLTGMAGAVVGLSALASTLEGLE